MTVSKCSQELRLLSQGRVRRDRPAVPIGVQLQGKGTRGNVGRGVEGDHISSELPDHDFRNNNIVI